MFSNEKQNTVTTSTGRNSLANNIAMQYNNRRTMFPDANIEFIATTRANRAASIYSAIAI